ncbi:hypothetical protein, conserved [Trypanosoma brucei gambiense DAL972]|uniref:Uncharacterized protein n=1 Tax=Trypanosoma brucei gambiense (strain MHOM/CI/86/DAL972) TaxID=679716 RepID=C9ZWW5_TRYB9|nr:hypothetical protein, conserved [Trypanosoma brucei gambiense DAL972]CBH13904.1 hypothetical protein, conserved [Trypanosoma brucei gambiense DAL972]|eukprot:XP_011776180.1 hypothetical protein, conserved [Trypanosoma brucei gambiense DAL972]
MSDSESIQFNVMSELESPVVGREGRNASRGESRKPSVKDLKRPPLHGAPSPTSRKSLRRSSEGSSLQFVVCGEAGGDDSDNTDTIQFNVMSELESPVVGREGRNASRGESRKPSVKDLKRPPLHGAPSPTSRKSLRRSSGGSSLQFVVCGEAGGDDSDNTDTIQFKTEGGSRNISLKAASPTSIAGNRRNDSNGRSLRRSSTESGDESVVFVIEDTQSTGGKKPLSRREASNDDTISFVVGDSGGGDEEGADGSSMQKSLSFTVVGSGELPVAPPVFTGKQGSSSPQLMSPLEAPSKPGVGSRDMQRPPKAVSRPKEANNLKGKYRSSSRANTGDGGMTRSDSYDVVEEGGTLKICSTASKHTRAGRLDIPHTTTRGKDVLPPTASEAGKLSPGETRTSTALAPSASALVPLPFPHPSQKKFSLKAADIEEMFLQAKVYTEHWRMFNDIQREEVARLAQRIVEIRDGSSNTAGKMKGKSGEEGKDKPLCFADLFRVKSFLKETDLPWNTERLGNQKKRLPPGRRPAAPARLVEGGKLPAGRGMSRRDDSGANRRQRPSPQGNKGTRVPKGAKLGVPHFENVAEEMECDAVAQFAEIYGVAWPPSSKNELFFLTGVRLTQKQCEEFYDSMRLYVVASSKVNANMNLLNAHERDLSPSRLSDAKRKVRVTRTTLLRKAFTVMDVEKNGVINAALLPSIQRLLEEERRHLQSVLGGDVTPETFLSRSRGEKAKLNGNVETVVSPKVPQNSTAVNAVGTLRIYSLVLDVLLPLLCASGLLTFDFTTVGLLVFGTLSLSTAGASPSFLKWREAAQRCFESLLKNPV